jgi:putative selenate reductase
LHVLAMNLVRRFRGVFGAEVPISFAAGIDRFNAADAVALGLAPITVCSDLLKTGGYSRQEGYFREIIKRMDTTMSSSVGDFILKAYRQGKKALDRLSDAPEGAKATFAALLDGNSQASVRQAVKIWGNRMSQPAGWADAFYERWVKEAALLNTDVYVAGLENDPRYAKPANSRDPQKVGSKLELFNCITCDKCVPVCPNDANFTFVLPQIEIPVLKWAWKQGRWERHQAAALAFVKKHQIANFADFCNECGNCDVFCPEDGGPYVMKPRFFGTLEKWKEFKNRDGFFIEKNPDHEKVHGRFGGTEFVLTVNKDGQSLLENGGVAVQFHIDQTDALPAVSGPNPAEGTELDFTYVHIMNWLRKAILSENEVNYVNA